MWLNIDYWLFQTVAMMIMAWLLPGVRITGFFGALCAVIALAFFNAHVWDAALFFQIPNTLTFHTLVLLVTNGVLFWIFAKIVPGIDVEGILSAIAAPVVFTLCSMVVNENMRDIPWSRYWLLLRGTWQSFKDQI